MIKVIFALTLVALTSGCSSFSINSNKEYKEDLCKNIGALYYQIAQAKQKGMAPLRLWQAIDLGIIDTIESSDMSESDVAALRQWGKSAVKNVYGSDETFDAKKWQKTAIMQCQSSVEIY